MKPIQAKGGRMVQADPDHAPQPERVPGMRFLFSDVLPYELAKLGYNSLRAAGYLAELTPAQQAMLEALSKMDRETWTKVMRRAKERGMVRGEDLLLAMKSTQT